MTRLAKRGSAAALITLAVAVAVAVAVVLGLAGCSTTADNGSSSTTEPRSDEHEAPTTIEEASERPTRGNRVSIFGLPDTIAARQFSALLEPALAATLTVEDVETRLTEEFLAQVPASTLVAGTAELPALVGVSPVVDRLLYSAEHSIAGTLVNSSDGTEWFFSTSVEVTEPHLINGFSIVAHTAAEADSSLGDLDDALDAWAAVAPLSAAIVVDTGNTADTVDPAGACDSPLVSLRPDEPLSIGSAFKFWVLAAVASAIDDGELAWTDELTITGASKSFPSGQLQAEDDGTVVTVAIAAELMIAISDNTATDLLIGAVGREAVEAELVATNMSDPGLNSPLMTTRELFLLKLGDVDRLTTYRDAGEDERRAILAELTAEALPELQPSSFTEPNEIGVEWLATPTDLCRVILDLADRATEDGDLATALFSASGALDPVDWPTAAFKGGSEPGVLSLTWLIEGADGRRFVVSGILNNPDAPIDSEQIDPTILRIFDLLAR